jgi:CDP-glucose 4,6-dehydratase
MELDSLTPDRAFWQSKNVFITGHTGFKGCWLSIWLDLLGANVTGFSLSPVTDPNIFDLTSMSSRVVNVIGDIRDIDFLRSTVVKASPEIVFHLAAQPLVRESYSDPAGTYATNVLGTVHLFEAVRATPSVRAIVNVTSDKCYENNEWVWGYRESDPLGGYDPYSNSKACSELVSNAYRQSFFQTCSIALATARAGNVIGGGDWSNGRLVPDMLKASGTNEPLLIRSPHAVRPWQHVLEPLAGYLLLAERLFNNGLVHAGPWNFGPTEDGMKTVGWIVEELSHRLQRPVNWRAEPSSGFHEAGLLQLDSSKAKQNLGWKPRWSLTTALDYLIDWHHAYLADENMYEICKRHISEYQKKKS